MDWLNWLTLGAIQGFTQGFSILMAQNFGAGQYEKLRRTMTNSLFLAVLCGVTLTIASEALAGPAVSLLKVPAEIRPISMAYLRIMFGGLPVVMAYNLAASILRSLGNSRTPLIAMVIASLTNVALDLLFVMGFGWGVEGAAAATIIAQCLSAIYCVWHICHIEVLHISREDWDIRASLCGRLMMLGSPMAFQNTVIAIGGMITQTIVNGFDVPFIAGFTATNKLYGVLEVAATSYGYSMVTYAGQNLGAGRTDRIRRGMRSAVLISLLTSLVITLLMIFAGKLILGCFISGTPEEFEQTLAIAYYYLAVMSICLPILYILHITRSAIQGMGNTILPLASGIAEFIMRTVSAVFLPMLIGENGIFYAEIMAWTGAVIILIISYFAVIRRTERMISH